MGRRRETGNQGRIQPTKSCRRTLSGGVETGTRMTLAQPCLIGLWTDLAANPQTQTACFAQCTVGRRCLYERQTALERAAAKIGEKLGTLPRP